VARKLGISDNARKTSGQAIALRAYYHGVVGDQSRVYIFFNKDFFPGYAWIFPLGGGRANVGLGMIVNNNRNREGSARNGKNLRETFVHWLQNDPQARAYLATASLEGKIVGWPLNTYTSGGRCTYSERVLLIGDAASLVDPINGEGIHTALESARLAARVADKALTVGDLSARFLSRYERAWQSLFDLDLRVADLYVTSAQNRSLTWLWLLALKLVAETARGDSDYAETVTGVLAGVVPARRTITPTFIAKTVLHSPRFYISQIHRIPQTKFGSAADRGFSARASFIVRQGRVPHEDPSTPIASKSQMRQRWAAGRWERDVMGKVLGILLAVLRLLKRTGLRRVHNARS
jgi:hypothetical protein